MAQKQNFYAGNIDRTPTGACVWVALLVIAAFLIGAKISFSAASSAKHYLHKFSRTEKESGVNSDSLIDRVREITTGNTAIPSANPASLQDQAAAAAEKVRQQAADALKAEAEKQAKEQAEKMKTQTQDQLQNYFSP